MTIDWSLRVSVDQRELVLEQAKTAADKQRRQVQVDALVVEIDGLLFQGDELSQGRMLRRADTLNGDETADWVLADNTVVQVTSAQLRAAARAAVDEMGRIWIGTA